MSTEKKFYDDLTKNERLILDFLEKCWDDKIHVLYSVSQLSDMFLHIENSDIQKCLDTLLEYELVESAQHGDRDVFYQYCLPF